ncbi:DUF1385 domain-containing protein [Dictyobacter formicarum]|uniref:Membrane protein n=1 Tax=Dictyobacter formicarum TaxID=2778368 RepID=A0ABQ3VNP0_9CHLR|nr:DUF1385 domain-containing protein [Dictyobacter formicarum]GHO87860.1 membrane protein [Dictyobacter formicarum]
MARFYYGGQAVMEGVMMRGRNTVAVAVRRPEGDIYVHEEALTPKIYQNKYLRLPFLRGMVLLWEMLVLGTRMMTLSANIASEAGASPAPTTTTGEEAGASSAPTAEKAGASSEAGESSAPMGGASMILPLIVSLTFAIAIFFVGPLLLTSLLRGQIGDGWLNLTLEGVIRLLLLVGYLYIIGRVPDIQRVFGYHGAEHKAINAMEQGDALTVENVRRASRVHTRCGTGFMLLVMVVSIVVFAFIGSPSLLIKIVSRIVLVPVVAGIAYEVMRLGAANYRYRVVRWLLAPGLALQGLTTREPDDSMIECAIASLQRVLTRDTEKQAVGKDEPVVPSSLVTNV